MSELQKYTAFTFTCSVRLRAQLPLVVDRSCLPGWSRARLSAQAPTVCTWTCPSVPRTPNPPGCKIRQLVQARESRWLWCWIACWPHGTVSGRSFSTWCELSLNNYRPHGWDSSSSVSSSVWKIPGDRAQERPPWASKSNHSQVCRPPVYPSIHWHLPSPVKIFLKTKTEGRLKRQLVL